MNTTFLENNPYRPMTDVERQKAEKERQELKKKLDEIKGIGQKLLAHEDFKRYRQLFTEVQEDILRQMYEHADPDPVKDAFFLRAMLNQLLPFKQLISMAEADSKRAIPEGDTDE